MNTSGPSSRPRKPYPLSLLNHFTVPFRRSTCAPSWCGSPQKGANPEVPRKCLGIVLLILATVKVRNQMPPGCARTNMFVPDALVTAPSIVLAHYNQHCG